MSITYLGPSGTFTHQAVLVMCPGVEAMPVGTQAEALAAVVDGTASRAVLPIDNTVNGVVVPTLDALLAQPGLSVVDSVVVPISFNAYTAGPVDPVDPGDAGDASDTDDAVDPGPEPTVVVSHPHALAQCRAYIDALGVPVREAASTAAACRDVGPGEIGLGPAVCGSLYPIRLVAEAVEDHEHAYTQFALIAPEDLVAEGRGDDGLLVALSPETNVPGILRRLLEVLEVRGVNMTNLVTRPVPASPGEFVFLLFLAGGFSAEDFAGMRAEWSALGCRARALGRISPLAELARAHAG